MKIKNNGQTMQMTVVFGGQCGYMLNAIQRCRRRSRILIKIGSQYRFRCVEHRKDKYLGRA